MKALLVDDHAMFRDGLALLMAQRFPGVTLLQAASVAEALAVAALHADLEVILLDLGLPDGQGFDALERLAAADTSAPIVVLSANDSPETVHGAIERGAAGFISKSAQAAVLEQGLRAVLEGRVFVPPSVAPAGPIGPAAALGLSPRQHDVLRLLIHGASNKQISRDLGLAESTVKSHIAAIFQRLDVSNRTQAVIAAARLGLRLPR